MAFNPADTDTGAIKGRQVTRRKSKSKRINLPPSPSFIFKAHPTRWGIIDGDWCPILSKMKLEPGIGGVGHNLNEANARENARQSGWTILDPDTVGEEYVQVYDGTGGPVHIEKWVTIKQVGGQVILKPDLAAYKEFLFRLVDSGLIEPLDEDIKTAMVAQQEQRISRNANKLDPAAKARTAADTAKLEKMKKPTRKKPTRKKKPDANA